MVRYQSLLDSLVVLPPTHAPKGSLVLEQSGVSVWLPEIGMEHNLNAKVRVVYVVEPAV